MEGMGTEAFAMASYASWLPNQVPWRRSSSPVRRTANNETPICSLAPSHHGEAGAARPSSAAPSLFFSRATPADNDVGLIASLGEGAHIGQHVPTLFLREAEIPRRHVRFAVMDSLEQVGIGFLSGRR